MSDPKEPVVRPLPASLEAEAHILACCMIEGSDAASRCAQSGVTTEHFTDLQNKYIFRAIQSLHGSGRNVAYDTVAAELETKQAFERAGGWPKLSEVTDGVPTTVHFAQFLEILQDKRRLREIIRVSTAAIEEAYGYTGGMDELVGRVSDDFNRALRSQEQTEEKFTVVAAQVAHEIEEFERTGVKAVVDGVPWGLHDIDKICQPMSPGELVILGGRPSTGKSALADQVAWRTADRLGNVLLFTFEMTKREKAIRIAQQICGLTHSKLAPGDESRRFAAALRRIEKCPNLHVFERDVSVGRIVGRCRTFAASKPVKLIVLDFLQYLARLEPTIGKERTDEKIGRLTAAMKDVARECKCPVLVLASLNRDGEKDGRPPRMSDLRSSGEIESDADVIALLHWPKSGPSGPQDPHDHSQDIFYVEFNQEKGRNKGVFQVGLHFNRRATRFDNYCP